MDGFYELLPFIIPLLLLQLALLLFGLIDLIKRGRTKGPKWIWGIVVVFVSILGPIAYLLFGREE